MNLRMGTASSEREKHCNVGCAIDQGRNFNALCDNGKKGMRSIREFMFCSISHWAFLVHMHSHTIDEVE